MEAPISIQLWKLGKSVLSYRRKASFCDFVTEMKSFFKKEDESPLCKKSSSDYFFNVSISGIFLIIDKKHTL